MLNLYQEDAGQAAGDDITLAQVKDYLIEQLPNIALALLTLILGWMISKWAFRLVNGLGKKRSLDAALMRFVAGLVQYAVLAAAIISALGRLGVETASLITIFATAGLAVGLALQGSLSNFASGVMILFFRPFTIGDRVKIAGENGKVSDIGIFTTNLLTPDNEKIIIPNSKAMGDVITNYTAEGVLRAGIEVGVAYGSDVNQVREILLNAAKRMELSLEEPAQAVVFTGLGASSLDFKVFAWATCDDYFPLQNAMRQAIYDDLNAAGIDIPFNQIVVHRAEEG